MVKEQNQNVDKYDIPVWRKYTLSVQEAAKYFHIGDKKLRKLIDENPDAEFILWNGSNYLPYKNGKYTIDSESSL